MAKLPEEVLLGMIANAGGGGGGGGTSNYNALENKPQIGGVTLTGNKSASDLGLADDTTVQGILDGQTIDSFSDVETALADKVNKVNGKGLSTNDYDDTEKGKNADNATAIAGMLNGSTINSFGDVETALSNKQDTLTFDSVPTDGSTNPVESNGVYDALALKADASIVKKEFIGTLEQWNALTTAEKKEYDKYQITNDYTGGSGSWNYSTSEVNTGQKWIDGKDIYARTYTGLSITTSTQWQNTGIDVSYADTILHGFAIDDAKQSIVCSFGGTGSTLLLRAYISTNVITTVTIYYTKTA